MKKDNLQIGVLGLWHLGLIYSVSLAKLGYKVSGFDLDKENINDLNLAKLPIYEPNLTDNLKKSLGKNLFFSNNAEEAIKNKDYVYVTLDTPINDKDEINLKSLNKLFDLVIKHSSKKTLIIISSQIPVGTTRSLIKKLKHNQVIYFPENLRLGNAIEDFLHPSRIVLGADDRQVISQFLKDFSFFKCEVLEMSIESAEMLKHALNSYLALNISFSSEISDLCELFGADMNQVVNFISKVY